MAQRVGLGFVFFFFNKKNEFTTENRFKSPNKSKSNTKILPKSD